MKLNSMLKSYRAAEGAHESPAAAPYSSEEWKMWMLMSQLAVARFYQADSVTGVKQFD